MEDERRGAEETPEAKLRRATLRRDTAEKAWRQAIVEASAAGCSNLMVGRVAHISHVRVLQIVNARGEGG
jgi:hypothetical protein